MSYSSRTRYKTMREKNQIAWKRTKMIVLFILLALLVYAYMNRVYIKDYITTSMY